MGIADGLSSRSRTLSTAVIHLFTPRARKDLLAFWNGDHQDIKTLKDAATYEAA
jgi:hypothetical protein